MKRPVKLKGRAINGIFLLDKPHGLTSNAALQAVKKLFNAAKAGHTGSLDPLASGMLPICLGEATKFSRFLLEADKRYHVKAQLGIETTTGDAEGEVVAENSCSGITAADVEAVLLRFRGEIMQVPSMYSALKYNGRPLYELARQGIEIEREARPLTIFSLILKDMQQGVCDFFVHCSKGTYVRTLIQDIGEALGCGAHVTMLVRESVAHYTAPDSPMMTLEALTVLAASGGEAALDATLLPVDSTVMHWPALWVSEAALYYLQQGQPVILPDAPEAGMLRLYTGNQRFVGVGEILEDGRVAPHKIIQYSE